MVILTISHSLIILNSIFLFSINIIYIILYSMLITPISENLGKSKMVCCMTLLYGNVSFFVCSINFYHVFLNLICRNLEGLWGMLLFQKKKIVCFCWKPASRTYPGLFKLCHMSWLNRRVSRLAIVLCVCAHVCAGPFASVWVVLHLQFPLDHWTSLCSSHTVFQFLVCHIPSATGPLLWHFFCLLDYSHLPPFPTHFAY